jgi:hypothetical protein
MSSVLIQQYLAELARLRQVGGTHRESVVREAFKKFNTCRFADYKNKVIDLITRVTRVSVETQALVAAMRAAPRTP